jgi:hypothetical protein
MKLRDAIVNVLSILDLDISSQCAAWSLTNWLRTASD